MAKALSEIILAATPGELEMIFKTSAARLAKIKEERPNDFIEVSSTAFATITALEHWVRLLSESDPDIFWPMASAAGHENLINAQIARTVVTLCGDRSCGYDSLAQYQWDLLKEVLRKGGKIE